MKKCPRCGRDYDTLFDMCPHCRVTQKRPQIDYTVKKNEKEENSGCGVVILGITTLMMVIACLTNNFVLCILGIIRIALGLMLGS